MPELIQCPKCGRKLKVPETLQGKSVKCPGCQAVFKAKFGAEEPPEEEEIPQARRRAPEPEEEEDEEEVVARPRRRAVADEDDEENEEEEQLEERPRRKRRGRRQSPPWGAVTAPAICLLITGILGFGWSVFRLLVTLLAAKVPVDPQAPEFLRKAQEIERGGFGVILAVLFIIVAVVIILGAIMMLRGKGWAIAVTSCILAMINLNGCCCILGIPFGIWSLVILMKPEIKEAFD
jgi:hypothetical protein